MNSVSKSLICAAILGVSGVASAGGLMDTSVSTATGIGNSQVSLDGVLHDIDGTEPWVGQVYAGATECLRLYVSTTEFDSKLTVIAPNGLVYRDDDSGDSLRPLVRIASAPVTGWYTVQVAHWTGAPVDASFSLKYARYNNGNPNCATPTSPLGGDLDTESTGKRAPVVRAVTPKGRVVQ